MKQYLDRYLFVLGGSQHRLIGLVALFLAVLGIELVGISLIGPFIAIVAAPDVLNRYPLWGEIRSLLDFRDDQSVLLLLGLAIALIFYTKAVVAFFVQRAILRFSYTHQSKLRAKLMQSFQSVPYEFYVQRNSAAQINAVNNHAAVYTNKTLIPSLRVCAEFVFLTGLLTFLAFIDLVTVIAMIAVVGAVFAVYQMLVKQRVIQAGRDTVAATEGYIRAVNQGMAAFKEIRVLGKERFFLDKLVRNADRYGDAVTQSTSIQIVPRYLAKSAMVTFVIGIAVVNLLIRSDLPSGLSVLGIFGFAAIRAMSPVSAMMNGLNDLRFSRKALDELYGDLQEFHRSVAGAATTLGETTAPMSGEESDEKFRVLELDDVSYRYPDTDVDAITSVSMTIRAGDSVGLIGTSGVGKTTLVDIILGLLLPTKGEVRVDGRPLAKARAKWNRLVGYIPQGNCLIDDTIRRNVAFGVDDGDIDEGRVRDAINKAQLEDVVEQLPKGLDTEIGERGVRLSGGQGQRIALGACTA